MINQNKLDKRSMVTLTFLYIRLCDMAKNVKLTEESRGKIGDLICQLDEYFIVRTHLK
jgi:hypothetical protein